MAAPPDSHASGNLAQDFFCPTKPAQDRRTERGDNSGDDRSRLQAGSDLQQPTPPLTGLGTILVPMALHGPNHSGPPVRKLSPHLLSAALPALSRTFADFGTIPGSQTTDVIQDAWTHYHHLLDLMSQLGLDAAQDKCEGPTTRITWIGVLFDTVRLTMAIDPAKVEEARLFCLDLMSASSIPVKKFQKFLGKLFHATKCTTGARTFFNRLLEALATGKAGSVSLGPQAKADIHWFLCFLGRFNGVTLIKPSVAQHVIHVDSCLQGGGGLCSGLQFYKISYPQFLMDLGLSISSLECWNLLVAARIWLPTLSGTTVLVFCDNWATVAAINSGRATDPIIRGSLRELWWLAASHDVQLEVRHKPGADMIAADTLSRATTSSTAAAKFAQFAQTAQESEVQPLPAALLPPFPF